MSVLNRPLDGPWAYVQLDATYRLVGTLLTEQTDEWQVTRRYTNQEILARVVRQGDTETELLAQSEAA